MANKCSGCSMEMVERWNIKYCSNQCQRQAEWRIRRDRIQSDGVVASGSPKLSKRYLRETKGSKCDMCGGTEWQGQPMPLILDHIDGNSDNWKLTNLRLVCGNCDMQLPTYKKKNNGKGRASRRERYAKGLSY